MKKKVLLLFKIFTILLAFNVHGQNIITVTQNDSGKIIKLYCNQVLEINLYSPGTDGGYGWYVTNINNGVIKQNGNPSLILDPDCAGNPGCPVTEIFNFIGISPGTSALTLVYKQMWMNVAPLYVFYITVDYCPSPTNTTSTANQAIFCGNTTILSASGMGTLGWYSAAHGGTYLGGGANYTTNILTANATFYVQDSSICGANAIRTSITVKVVPQLIVKDIKYDRATLKWQVCAGAFKYRIQLRNALNPLYAIIAYTTTDSLVVNNLTASSTYYLRVSPTYGGSWQSYSDSCSFTTANLSMIFSNTTFNKEELTWTDFPGAVKFAIRYKTPTGGYITKYTTTNKITLTGLLPSMNYTWQVNPDYGSGYTTYTPSSVFTTAALPNMTANPVNFNQATLSWDAIPGAINYAVKYSRSGYTVVKYSTNTSLIITGLSPGTAYTWQINPDYGSGWTSYTPLAVFNTPSITMTANPVNFNQATLSWDAIPGAVNYAVKYSRSGYTVVKYSTNTSLIIMGLTPGTAYTWQINPDYGSGWTSYTPLAVFNTPSITMTANPVNFNQATLSWDAIPSAINYAVKYSRSGYTVVKYSTNTSLIITGLTQGTAYTWQINPDYGSGWTSYTPLAIFNTPSITMTANPVNFNQATLSWDAIPGAVNYAVKYLWGTKHATKYSTTNTIAISGLITDTAYSWKVMPDYGSGWTSYTPLDSFKTVSPVLTTNSTGANIASLNWTGITGATIFAIKYYKTGIPTSYTVKYSAINSINLTGLAVNTAYTWYVNPNYGNGYTSYTPAATFSTSSLRLANPELSNAEEPGEMIVFPNPASAVISIKYKVQSTEGSAQYAIYNSMGEMITNSSFLQDEFQINISNFSKGIYFLKVLDGTQTKMQKIIVD